MAVSSRRDSSSSSKWWSLSSKSAPASSSKPQSTPGSKFNTLVSVIGFKPKKHPSLAIQEPPYITSSSSPASTIPSPITDIQPQPQRINRPPSKSVSSIKSPVESIPPATPVDLHQSSHHHHHHHDHHRQSLFTLSDSDPFASQHNMYADTLPSDPNRLSVYSGSSASDYASKKNQSIAPNRTSYASSSVSSTGEQLSPTKWPEPSQSHKLKTRRSHGSLHRKVSLLSADSALSSAWESLTHSTKLPCASSSTPVDPHRRSQPPPSPLPRPPMRARGLTDVGFHPPSPNFHSKVPFSSSSSSPSTYASASPSPPQRLSPTFATSPTLRRIQSSTRVASPPSAPPTQDLPLPPALIPTQSADDDSDILPDNSTSSTTSSSLSFASSASSRDAFFSDSRKLALEEKSAHPLSIQGKKKEPGSREKVVPWPAPIVPPPLHSPPASPRTVRRTLSHHSLTSRRRTSTSSTASGPPIDVTHDKAPRKQRSYPRIPVPPLPQPLRHASSFGPSDPLSIPPISTQRTSSAHGSPLSRTRLFSGPTIRRPSTSQCTPVDDDTRSVFSLPLEQERMQGLSVAADMAPPSSSARPFLHARSSLDSGSLDEPSSPSTSDYTPRRIKSPAELLKIEASVHETKPSYIRARGLSFTSMSTMSEMDDLPVLMPHSPPTSLHLLPTLPPHTGLPLRSASLMNKGHTVPRLAVRPSTSQATVSPPGSPTFTPSADNHFFPPSSVAPHIITTSLPPPPRPRLPRPSTAPLSPPPEPPTPVSVNNNPSQIIPLAPAPRMRSLIPKFPTEKRRSLMRKPSFLEIDDDLDGDDGRQSASASGSFLDLSRESFDTVRTIDE